MMGKYQVKPGSKVRIKDWDPDDRSAFDVTKEQAKTQLLELNKKLEALQEILYAEHKHKILIVIQAMDTAGKDSVIRSVFEGVNPQGVRVASFKAPTPEERDHDYLWRVHKETPGKGQIVVFNRSHYEDVLVVRVHQLVPEDVWKNRYRQINEFERMLVQEGTTLLKFYLNINRADQRKRLQDRLDDETKHWKFNVDDLKERRFWKLYMKAYEDAMEKTSTPWAPWYIVPARTKWYRNLVIATTLVKELSRLDMRYPPAAPGLKEIIIR
jgi:PPK2 family polyphosphate:nucleotide phosphotransferase